MSTKSITPEWVERGIIAAKDGLSFTAIQQAMLTEQAPEAAPAVPTAPPLVHLTDEVKKAIRRLPEVFAEVQPIERRALSETEFAAVYDEYATLTAITELLSGRKEDLKEIVRNHMDVTAEAEGRVNPTTEVDASGHYVLAAPKDPERAHVPGTNMDYSREYRSGKISVDTSVIEQMFTDGEISRETYLAMTRERRVFDEAKTVAAINNADLRSEVLTVIKSMTRVGKAGTALFVRKAK